MHSTYEDYKLLVAENGYEYAKVPNYLRNDRDLFLVALTHPYFKCGPLLQIAGPAIRNNAELVLIATYKNTTSFQYASAELRDNKKVVLKAIEIEFGKTPGECILKYVSERLRADYDVVYASLAKGESSLKYASEQLRRNKVLVLVAVKKDGLDLKYAPEFCDDEDVVVTAINTNVNALKYASDRLRDTKHIVLIAIKNTKYRNSNDILKYASSRLRCDEEVIKAAILINPINIRYAGSYLSDTQYLWSNKELVLSALPYSLEHNNIFNEDLEFLSIAVHKCGFSYKHTRGIVHNRELALAAVTKSGNALEFVKEFRSDKEVVLAAVKSNPEAMRFATGTCLHDRDILKVAVKYPAGIRHIPKEELDDELIQIHLESIRISGFSGFTVFDVCDLPITKSTALLGMLDGSFRLKDLPRFQDDEDIVIEAVKFSGDQLEYASERLRKMHHIVLAAVKSNGNAIKFADKDVIDEEIMVEAMNSSLSAIKHIYNTNTHDLCRNLLLKQTHSRDLFCVLKAIPAFRDDKEVVTATVKMFTMNLIWADKFRDDEDVVLNAVDSNALLCDDVFVFASKNIRMKHKHLYKFGEFL